MRIGLNVLALINQQSRRSCRTRLREKPLVSGERDMPHSFANLEYHHFKYSLFRVPGDVHVHMFGMATLSFCDGIRTQEGDVLKIRAVEFGLPLRNFMTIAREEEIEVRQL
jgi:hypothetical protein